MAAMVPHSSFRDAPLGAGPESRRFAVLLDSGFARRRAPRNDEGKASPFLHHPVEQLPAGEQVLQRGLQPDKVELAPFARSVVHGRWRSHIGP